MKELIINGKVYAKYEMDGTMLYLKMIIHMIKGDPIESENLLVKIIHSVEDRHITSVSYLNVNI